jgi:hypothetical protein
MVVSAQVAGRVAASWASADNDAVLAVILGRLVLKTDVVPEGTLRQMIAVYTGTKDMAVFLSFATPDFLQRLLEAQRERAAA